MVLNINCDFHYICKLNMAARPIMVSDLLKYNKSSLQKFIV